MYTQFLHKQPKFADCIIPLSKPSSGHILTEIYIEALLVDEELADQVWEAWDKGEIDDLTAILAWLRVATRV